MRHLTICFLTLFVLFEAPGGAAVSHKPMQVGVDADNWTGQIKEPNFEKTLGLMNLDFIDWHLSPEEEDNPKRLQAIIDFCHKNHWSYLFNTELANYLRIYPPFKQADGSYRYDLADRTLEQLANDPLLLGVVYDEADLVQTMLGENDPKGKPYDPYFVDTRKMTASEAFLSVADKVASLTRHYQAFDKRLIFEMTFPDYPFAFARGGALLAPKLLKENFNDLMYDVYRGAALEYSSKELWTCIDLWFVDRFPSGGKHDNSYHTPEHLLDALEFAYSAGFDFAYVESYKGLMTESFELNAYGQKLIEFGNWRKTHQQGDWRTAPVKYYVKRFPDGYWGQDYSTFIPDHPYGSWLPNPYRAMDDKWLQLLHDLSHGSIPADANNWNAQKSPDFKGRPYQAIAGLPPLVVFDHLGQIPRDTGATVIDLTLPASKEAGPSAK